MDLDTEHFRSAAVVGRLAFPAGLPPLILLTCSHEA